MRVVGPLTRADLEKKRVQVIAECTRYTVFELSERHDLTRDQVKRILKAAGVRAKPAGIRLSSGRRAGVRLTPERRAEIRAWRQSLGWSQAHLATKTNLHRQTIHLIELGKCPVSEKTLAKILATLSEAR